MLYVLRTKAKNDIERRLHDEATRDSDSTYVSINPTLLSPTMYQIYTVNKSQRIIMTKYRTGSDYLNVHGGTTQRKGASAFVNVIKGFRI